MVNEGLMFLVIRWYGMSWLVIQTKEKDSEELEGNR